MKSGVMKTKVAALLLCASVILSSGGCGNPAGNSDSGTGEKEMGRYVEETVQYGDENDQLVSLVQENETLRLIDLYGRDMISYDGGLNFEEVEAIQLSGRDKDKVLVLSSAGTSDGSRICMEYIDGIMVWWLVTADGREIKLEGLGDNDYPSFYQGAGCFYMSKGFELYRIDPETGEMAFLTESAFYPMSLVADEKMLYVIHANGVLLYDLQENRAVAKQDEVLSSFFSGKQEELLNDKSSILLYPCGEEIYMLTHGGIFSHKLYGDGMDCVVDGGTCSIGNIDRGFAGMAVTEGSGYGNEREIAEDKAIDNVEENVKDNTEDSMKDGAEYNTNGNAEKIFTILYTDGKLMRYVKDKSLPTEPEVSLRIYSLYEDGNIRQAVSAFRQKYPELYIKYEVGVNPDYGVTKEDALRSLSTEIAAGTGPDILVVDDIPFETYAEKGVLEELGFLREGMSDEEYFETVLDGFSTGEGLYVMPLVFAVPVLAGDAGKVAEAGEPADLSQLADLLEKEAASRNGTTGGQAGAAGESDGMTGGQAGSAGVSDEKTGRTDSVIGFTSAEEALRLFAQSSMGAWETEEGALDREAVEEFLTQVKRIYDIQMKNMPDNIQDMFFSGTGWGSGENTLARRNGSYGLAEALDVCIMRYPEQPFCAGYLSSAIEDFPMTMGKLHYKVAEGGYIPLPGQKFGSCLPATLMSINSGTTHEDESRLFMEYVFSAEFQGAVSLNGTPVNRSAYLQGQKNPKEGREFYATLGYGLSDSTTIMEQISWPSGEDFARLDNLVENISGVNYCDSRIYEAVIELGQAALTGKAGIEETVDEIEKALELYLAE